MDMKKKPRDEEENTEKTKEQFNEERLSALIRKEKSAESSAQKTCWTCSRT